MDRTSSIQTTLTSCYQDMIRKVGYWVKNNAEAGHYISTFYQKNFLFGNFMFLGKFAIIGLVILYFPKFSVIMAKQLGNSHRHFVNEFQDFNLEKRTNVQVDHNEVRFAPEFRSSLEKAIIKLQNVLDSSTDKALSYGHKIYTGSAGIAMLYLLRNKPEVKDLIKSQAVMKAKSEVIKIASNINRANERISFLNGDVGIIALASVIHTIDGNKIQAMQCAEKMLSFAKYALQPDISVPDELLYGRSGYLHALLFVRKYTKEAIPDAIAKQVVKAIIDSGRKLSATRQHKEGRMPPLQFEWHETEYVGAAHGYCGILSTLLMAYKEGLMSESDLNTYIRPTIDYILKMQYPSKNIPSSVNSRNYDVLVQWCHGAPGATHLVGQAYDIFRDQKYLKAAIDFGEVTWDRGLLTKGYNLCHGVAGNAYTFLKLYQLTNDIKHLHRATKFAEWCFTYGANQSTEPDRPYSLFEGLAGVIYFLVDMLNPNEARFPGVELL